MRKRIFDQDSLSVETVRNFHDHENPMDPFADDARVGLSPRLIKEMESYLVELVERGIRYFLGE